MTPADPRAAAPAGLATVEDLAAAAGLTPELAGELDAEALAAALADVDAAADRRHRAFPTTATQKPPRGKTAPPERALQRKGVSRGYRQPACSPSSPIRQGPGR
jgi:hypothetical protein